MDIGRPTRSSTIEPNGAGRTDRSACLRLRADVRSLAPGRDAVRRTLRREGWEEEPAELVVLAVCEALTNAIEHGSPAGANDEPEPKS